MTERIAPVITAEHLTFAYPGKSQHVLDIPHLQINAAERVFIKGASGSGKSTLLSLLAGVLVPTSGVINILGQPLNQMRSRQRDHFRADHIGFIFQMFNLIPYLSVIDNVILPCHFSKQRQSKACTQHSVHQEAQRLLRHLGLDDDQLHHRRVTELSIGQQQRVAAARALIGAPEIIIADEPTSSLDADARASFLQLLFAECAAAQSTLLFVSHDASLESLFPRSLALHDLNQAGTH